MIQDLIAIFGKSDGGTHKWTYKDLDPSLSDPEIKEACELLTTLNIFEQNGVKLFDSVVTIKALVHKERLIFDPEHDPESAQSEAEQPQETTCAEVRCFEVRDAAEQEEQAPLMEPSSPYSRRTPYGRYFKQLTTIDTEEQSAAAPTAEKETLLQPKTTDEKEEQLSSSQAALAGFNQRTKEPNRLLCWVHKIRKHNKEGPPTSWRE